MTSGPGHGETRVHARPSKETAMLNDAELRQRTKDTAHKLFHTAKGATDFATWKRFDKDLARDLSMFYTGGLYSREVISQTQRELCAVASLTVLHRPHELGLHIHAALNVGATRREVAEVIFQQVTYGGMPVVVDALNIYAEVLKERGEPFPAEDPSTA
jgi:4-carboxymuconolactone decarboxylase